MFAQVADRSERNGPPLRADALLAALRMHSIPVAVLGSSPGRADRPSAPKASRDALGIALDMGRGFDMDLAVVPVKIGAAGGREGQTRPQVRSMARSHMFHGGPTDLPVRGDRRQDLW